MPINLTQKKSDAISKLVDLSNTGMTVAVQIAEFIAYCTDNGFLAGGANQITDADFLGDNGHIDQTKFNAAITALQTITLSNANKTTLRLINKHPIPTRTANGG